MMVPFAVNRRSVSRTRGDLELYLHPWPDYPREAGSVRSLQPTYLPPMGRPFPELPVIFPQCAVDSNQHSPKQVSQIFRVSEKPKTYFLQRKL